MTAAHDPLCQPIRRYTVNGQVRCDCPLIAAVRERTLDEAVAAVESMPYWHMPDGVPKIQREGTIAAVNDLRPAAGGES